MFDSGFLEMMVIAVIALLVVGPERLPGLARKAGKMVGKAKAFVNSTKADIEKEIQAEEMKSMLSRQEKEISELRDMMKDAHNTIHNEVAEMDQNLAEKTGLKKPPSDDESALLTDTDDNRKA